MKIENYREQADGGYAVALFDVYIPALSLTLHNLKLVLSKKGSHFIGYPSFKEQDETGKDVWTAYFQFSAEKKKDFEREVFEELKNFIRGPLLGQQSSR